MVHAHAADVASKVIPPIARSLVYAIAVAMPLPEAPQVDLQCAIIDARTALDRLAAEPATPVECSRPECHSAAPPMGMARQLRRAWLNTFEQGSLSVAPYICLAVLGRN